MSLGGTKKVATVVNTRVHETCQVCQVKGWLLYNRKRRRLFCGHCGADIE